MATRQSTSNRSKIQIVVGAHYGRWTVLSDAGRDHRNKPLVLCRCECGTERVVMCQSLRRGVSLSCGCLHSEITIALFTQHGGKGTRLYNMWRGMKGRCETTTNGAYAYYGGRGITVCHEWHDFAVFREWATKNGYEEGLTLDRRDNSEGYSPSNCRWVPMRVQNRNTRRAILVTAFGETRCVADWVTDERCSISRNTIIRRIRRGISPEDAISIPGRMDRKETY